MAYKFKTKETILEHLACCTGDVEDIKEQIASGKYSEAICDLGFMADNLNAMADCLAEKYNA